MKYFLKMIFTHTTILKNFSFFSKMIIPEINLPKHNNKFRYEVNVFLNICLTSWRKFDIENIIIINT